MGISPERQFAAFLYAILAGVICGILYDCVRVSRVLLGIARYTRAGNRMYDRSLPLIGAVQPAVSAPRHRGVRLILLAAGDLLFAAFAGVTFSVFLYHAASGCFRWFYLLGGGIGFLLYYQTAGRLVVLSSEALVFCLRVVIRYLFWLFFAPFRALWWLLCRLGACINRHICRPICVAVRLRYRVQYTRRVRQALPESIRFTLTDPP